MSQPPPRPTDAELAILRVLWQRGPSTVRQVYETIASERDLGYTSVLKLLQVMMDKGLVERDDEPRSHVYRPARTEVATQDQLVDDLLDRAFDGSAGKLVLRALSAKPASAEELAEIRRLLENLERGGAR